MNREMDLISKFLRELSSQNTRRAYRSDLDSFFGSGKKGLRAAAVREVTRSQIQAHLAGLRSDGKSVSTRRRRLSALRRFYDWARDHGFVEKNPARECSIEDASSQSSFRSQPSVLSKSEVEQLLRAPREAGSAAVRNHGILLTILYASLRRAEIAAMEVDHFRPLGRHWVIDLPAGSGRPGAYVKIPEPLVEAIDAVQSRYDIDEGPLWRSLSNRNYGERLTPDAVYKIVRRTGKTAGLKDVSIETLRHTGLRLAMQSGASVRQIQMHARLQSATSVERYVDEETSSGRLTESAAEYLDLDLPDPPN